MRGRRVGRGLETDFGFVASCFFSSDRVLRKEMYRYLEIRGDDRNKAMLQWIKGEKEIASWVR